MRLRLGIAAALAALLLVVVGLVWWSGSRPSRIDEAVDKCELIADGPLPDTVTTDDDSVTVQISEDDGESYAAGVCVLAALDMPDAYASRMETTSRADGQQTAEHDGLSYSWSNTGGAMVVTVTED